MTKNMAIFDFESICVQEDKLLDTDTTTWIGQHVLISVSISSNRIQQPILFCNSNPGALVQLFFDAFDGLATQSKAQRKLKFGIETSVKSKVSPLLINAAVARNQYCNLKMSVSMKKSKTSRHSFQKHKKNQLNDLQDHLLRYCNVFPVFGFNSAKYENNFKKTYLLLLLVNERGNEPIAIKKANQFVSFKFGDVQLLYIYIYIYIYIY